MEPVPADCPTCGEGPHEVLKSSEAGHTVKCLECGHVQRLPAERERQATLNMVLSDGATSWSERMQAPADEPVRPGDEFELDGHRYLVTGIERVDGTAQDQALAEEVRVLHAKRFDQVVLKLSLNEGEATQSGELQVEPEHPVRIGEVLDMDGRKVVVKTLKSDENRTVRRGGLEARHIVRAFCDPAPPQAEVGTILPVRPSSREKKRMEEAEQRKAARDKARKAAHAQRKNPAARPAGKTRSDRASRGPASPPGRSGRSPAPPPGRSSPAPPPGRSSPRRPPTSKGPARPPGR